MFRRRSLVPIGELPSIRLFIDENVEAEPQTACSPDEFVISQRGRRSLPDTWSPDENLRKQNYHNSSKKSIKPAAAMKMRATLRSTAYKRRLLGPEDSFINKSKLNKKPDPANMVTTGANHKKLSFTPEKMDFTDLSTPPKFMLLTVGKPQVEKPALKFNLDAVSTPKSNVSGPRKRVLDDDDVEASASKVKKLKY